MHELLRGLITGALAACTILITLRPAVPYPKWMLLPFEHRWLLPLIAVAVAVVFAWDMACGAMLILAIVSMILDISVFGKTVEIDNEDREGGLPEDAPMISEPGPMVASSVIKDHYSLHANYAPLA